MATLSDVELVQVARLEPEVREEFRTIYEDSFPPSQRASVTSIGHDLATGARRMTAANVKEALAGFAIYLPIGDDAYLLEYLAVDRDRRGRGIGGRLLEEVSRLVQVIGASGYLLEVEAEPNGDEPGVTERRLRFYLNHGAEIVECAPAYVAPNAVGGEPIPMKLLWIPLRSDARAPRGGALQELLVGIFARSYGLAKTHPLVGRNLQALTC